MSDKRIDPQEWYSTGEVAEFVQLSAKQVGRVADAGLFPGARRKSPVSGSPREIPGTAVMKFLEDRQKMGSE